MASISATPGSLPLLGRLRAGPAESTAVRGSLSFPPTAAGRRGRFQTLSIRAAATAVPTAPDSSPAAISLSDKALNYLTKLRAEKNEDLCLRIGVKQGGCSGMSYIMEFENRSNAKEGDSVIEYDGFAIVCDPKSLLFLYGMQLDFSDALMGGGFTFKNPNATKTCGCGKSFAAGAKDGVDTTVSSCGTSSCDS